MHSSARAAEVTLHCSLGPAFATPNPQAADRKHGRCCSLCVIIALLVWCSASFGRASGRALLCRRPARVPGQACFAPTGDTIIVTADSGFGTLQDVLSRRFSRWPITRVMQWGQLSLAFAREIRYERPGFPALYSRADGDRGCASHLPQVVPTGSRSVRATIWHGGSEDDNVSCWEAHTNQSWAEVFRSTWPLNLWEDAGAHSGRSQRNPGPVKRRFHQGERDVHRTKTYARIGMGPMLDHTGHILWCRVSMWRAPSGSTGSASSPLP